MGLTPSVIYRSGPPTAEDYMDAIEELSLAMGQLEADGQNCAVCHDSGHQAWQCHHNPLVMARRCAVYQASFWRCFHCDEEFFNLTAAREHFGAEKSIPPACLTDVKKLVALMKAAVELAIIRGDLRSEEQHVLEEETTPEDIERIAQDAANAVRGIDTCAEEPIPEWLTFFPQGQPIETTNSPTGKEMNS